MQSKEKQDLIFIRLFKNESVNDEIQEACKFHNVKTAVVLSGIGQLKNVKLGYFKKKNDYTPELFKSPYELLSLTGNICCNEDDYQLHLHAVLGDEKKNAVGGHFIEGEVSITCEIILLKSDIDVKRKVDEKTGLKSMIFK
jgi:predicted DNA-binding protein with PD1-like motif